MAAIGLSIPCYGQDPKDPEDYSEKRNEINIGFFNAFELNAINELGIGYKHSTEKGALILATGFSLNPIIRTLLFLPGFVTSFYKSLREYNYDYSSPPADEIITYKENKAGLRPILGLTVFLSKSISLSTETYLNLLFYKTTYERDNSDGLTTETSKGLDMGLGPLGIVSVNFHF